jgi:hypothetical protein
MTMAPTRPRLTVAGLMALGALAACKGREQAPSPPPPPQTAPSAAPTTTTTTTTTVPSPPPVWRSAHWGMTKAQVLAAFPGEAQQLAQPVNFGPEVPGASDLTIPAYEADGLGFRVLFGFEADSLNRVHLSVIKAAEATCGDVEKLLTDKHSAPADRSSTRTNLRTDRTVWKLPEETITLACSEKPGLGYRSVTLDYTTPSGI